MSSRSGEACYVIDVEQHCAYWFDWMWSWRAGRCPLRPARGGTTCVDLRLVHLVELVHRHCLDRRPSGTWRRQRHWPHHGTVWMRRHGASILNAGATHPHHCHATTNSSSSSSSGTGVDRRPDRRHINYFARLYQGIQCFEQNLHCWDSQKPFKN